jgi:hypothetical protein
VEPVFLPLFSVVDVKEEIEENPDQVDKLQEADALGNGLHEPRALRVEALEKVVDLVVQKAL